MQLMGSILLLLGSSLVLVAALGVLRLPDVYCRAHALSKALTLGLLFLLVGWGLQVPEVSWFKLGLALFFQFLTIPVSGHLLSRVGFQKQVQAWSASGWQQPPVPTWRKSAPLQEETCAPASQKVP